MSIIDAVLKEANRIGVSVESIQNNPLKANEKYMAYRNGNVKVLTCKHDDRENRWVVPLENEYLYDTWECFRVIYKDEAK